VGALVVIVRLLMQELIWWYSLVVVEAGDIAGLHEKGKLQGSHGGRTKGQ
jgi:hypothetical protein